MNKQENLTSLIYMVHAQIKEWILAGERWACFVCIYISNTTHSNHCFNSCQVGILCFERFLLDVLVNKNLWARLIAIHFETYLRIIMAPLCKHSEVISLFVHSLSIWFTFWSIFSSLLAKFGQTSPQKVLEGKESNDIETGSIEQMKTFSV